MPQLFAIQEIYYQTRFKQLKHVKLIADGGMYTSGDVAKALGAGADAVMLGGMFAGTSETPGNVYRNENGDYYKVYGGSASAENKGNSKFVEGMTKEVKFNGHVKYILREIEDGIRSAMSYVGAHNLRQFREKCKFQEISIGGKEESKYGK